MTGKVDCFIFYFDVIGVVDKYLQNTGIINNIEDWQRAVRDKFTFAESETTCKTLFDNVWTRITSRHPESDIFTVLDFAGETMRLAKKFGFDNYFGAITYGEHSYNVYDRTLIAGGNPTNIIKQHIDTLGPAHIRAAFVEKWSAMLHRGNIHPALNSVWVSEEALFGIGNLYEVVTLSNLPRQYNVLNLKIDLKDPQFTHTKIWPFSESCFQFITA